jgi:hypothetical protein
MDSVGDAGVDERDGAVQRGAGERMLGRGFIGWGRHEGWKGERVVNFVSGYGLVG